MKKKTKSFVNLAKLTVLPKAKLIKLKGGSIIKKHKPKGD